MAIDDFMSDDTEYDGRYLRIKSGTEELWAEVQRKHKLDRRISNIKTNKQWISVKKTLFYGIP